MTVELHEEAVARGAYGLKWEADRQGLSLHTYDVEKLAANTIRHAVGSGQIVDRSVMMDAVEKERRRGDVQLRRACAAEGNQDRLLCRLQVALSAWEDREAALVLAAECGVMLLPEGS